MDVVFNTLLHGIQDYSTDRRGDVGSWCRIAALQGLETLTFLAVEASNSIPQDPLFLPNNNVTKKSENLLIVPSFYERSITLEQYAQNRVKSCVPDVSMT